MTITTTAEKTERAKPQKLQVEVTSSNKDVASKDIIYDDDIDVGVVDVDTFFKLVFQLSSPLYILTALTSWNMLGPKEMAPLYIMLVTFIPCLAVFIHMKRTNNKNKNMKNKDGGGRWRQSLYARCFKFDRKLLVWYCLAFAVGPIVAVVTQYVAASIPETDDKNTDSQLENHNNIIRNEEPMAPLTVVNVCGCMLLFIIMAAGEEIGWMGYVFESLKKRYDDGNNNSNNNASVLLKTALHLGVVWAIWHVPFFFFLFPPPLIWTIPCQVITLLANRIVYVWLYENSNRVGVLPVIICHAMDNVPIAFSIDYTGTRSVIPCVMAVLEALPVFVIWSLKNDSRADKEKQKRI